ncbi:MAG: ATP-dependent DNA helicase RecG [Bdellovibrionales bacterium]|nr:ATP-dependent DNA helicase RecG [Bdellovibrionales bacterium]
MELERSTYSPQSFLSTPLQYIKGVGPNLYERFKKKGLYTVSDLLNFYPRTYHDFRVIEQTSELLEGKHAVVSGEIFNKRVIRRFKGRNLYIIQLRTENLGMISLKYFKLPYKGFLDSIEIGDKVKVSGEVHFYQNHPEFHHPDFLSEKHPIEKNLVPVYSEIEGISQKKIIKTIDTILNQLTEDTSTIPEWIKKEFNLLNSIESLRDIHQPKENPNLYFKYQAPSQQTLIFEEFFKLQLHLCLKKLKFKQKTSIPLKCEETLNNQMIKNLPFELTSAQKKVFNEIKEDLEKPYPMHRLIQGDVGSGKTLVALQSALHAIESGTQCALMVPTEILAEQHFKQAKKRLKDLPINISLLTSKIKNKKEILQSIKTGKTNLCIGTHALIQESVNFQKLGLVIIDEQHRFGVEQRRELEQKGIKPHCLVMTATPIPRTLSMTAYGDLDISIIDEMPKGRKPIITRKTKKRKEVFTFLEQEVLKGRQAYVVYPLVEESEKIDLKNAVEQFEKLKTSFPKLKWGLLHGQMKPEEKSKIMEDFISKNIDVLVATTVIEVGVDVPNATIMVVEHSERFGLSQLHQLRGRVGRGSEKSYCVLILGDKTSKESYIRAAIMEKYSDGFRIAEEDLNLRGAGEFFGTRQSGNINFRIAHVIRDVEILRQARRAAQTLIDRDPTLKNEPLLKQEMQRLSQTRLT